MTGSKHPLSKVGRNPRLKSANSLVGTESHKTKIMNKLRSIYKKTRALNRNTKLAVILTAVLLVVGVTALSMSASSKNGQGAVADNQSNVDGNANQITAKIILKEGTLQIKNENGDWVDSESSYEPKQGDSLKTVGASSRSVIKFEGESELRIDSNSEIEIKSMTTERLVIKHVDGYLYSRVVAQNNRTYIIESEDAQYESMGTSFKTITNGDEQAVEVYHNSVHETVTNEKPKEGEKLTVKNRANKSKNGKIEKIDIEVVKKDQFMIWNRSLDQQDEQFKNELGILKDFDGPEITVNTPADGSTVLVEPNAADASAEFSGKTEASSKLTVQSKSQSGSQPIEISVGPDGGFTSPVVSAPIGSSVFEFVARDRAGNVTTKNIKVNFQKKSAPVTVSVSSGISMTLSNESNNVDVEWRFTPGYTPKNGVKVVYSKSSNPAYKASGVNDKSSNQNEMTVKFDKSDKNDTYYFRVCDYDSSADTCTNYSNQESIKIQ